MLAILVVCRHLSNLKIDIFPKNSDISKVVGAVNSDKEWVYVKNSIAEIIGLDEEASPPEGEAV